MVGRKIQNRKKEKRMKASERRKMYQKEMQKRTEESYNTKDNSGKFGNVFKKDLKDVPFFKLTNDEHYIDIIPYVAGKNNPKLEEGEPGYFLDLWIHRGIGVNENSYVCMSRNFNKPCPICDYQKQLKEDEDEDHEDEIKSLNPTRRAIYNIVCRTNSKEEKKGVQVWEVAHFSFEKELAERAKKKKGGGFVAFADPDEGKTISFRVTKAGTRDVKITAIEFEDRDSVISDDELEGAFCLDELIEFPDEEELRDIFLKGNKKDDEDEEEERPRNRKKKNDDDEEEEKPRSKRKKDDDEEEEKPRSRRKKDDDEEEEEKPRNRRKKDDEEDVPDPDDLKDPECPEGEQFGVDFNFGKACKKCKLKDECEERSEALEDAEKEKEKEEEEEEEEEKPAKRRRRTRA